MQAYRVSSGTFKTTSELCPILRQAVAASFGRPTPRAPTDESPVAYRVGTAAANAERMHRSDNIGAPAPAPAPATPSQQRFRCVLRGFGAHVGGVPGRRRRLDPGATGDFQWQHRLPGQGRLD